jgi:large repetitive protein
MESKIIQPRASTQTLRLGRFVGLLLNVSLLVTVSPSLFAQIGLPIEAASRPDRILVKPKVGANLADLHSILGIQVLREYPEIGNLQVLQLPAESTVAAVIITYQASGLVEYAEPDLVVRALAAPNDRYFTDNSLWGLHNTGQFGGKPDGDIDAPEAWDILHDPGNVIVAVIDTGIRATHEDLAANLWINPGESGFDSVGLDKRSNGKDDDGNGYVDDVNGINAILGLGTPIDDHGHGTHVAGIIGAVGNNGVGVVGIAWRAQLMALKFLNTFADGSISDALECIDYARRKGAKIINASWGWYGENSAALRDAIRTAGNAGIIFVAATGNNSNNNDTNPLYPASFDLDNILAVAATTRADQIADWSNFGPTRVHLGAPGEEILSCGHTNDSAYRHWIGTSMAAPHVVGACALLRSQHPSDSHVQIIHRLLSATDPLPSLTGKCVSGGRLNLQRALAGSDQPVITLSELDPEARETGPNPGVVRLHRTGDPSQAIEVRWTFSGAASNGFDFQQLPISSSFPAGAQADLIITPIDDTEVEGIETVTVTLLDGPGYIVGSPRTATVRIADNDQPPTTDEPVITLSELDPQALEIGPNPGVIRFHRTGDPSQAIEVRWTFSGSASNGLDFQQLPTSSPFPAGSEADLTITPIDDAEFEGNETVIVTLVDGPGYRVGSPSTATVTIVDNDLPPPPPPPDAPIITLSELDPEALEAGAKSGVIRFHRTGDPSQTIEVRWTFSGTASNGADFQQVTSSPFPAGSEANLPITPIDDAEFEGNETVIVTLVEGSGYRVGSPNTATVTIVDNDEPPPPPPTLTITATDDSASESGNTGTFTINRNGSVASPLTVSYMVNGTAGNGLDYETLSGSLTIEAGSGSAVVVVVPLEDGLVEGAETVTLTLSPNPVYTVGSPAAATVTIADNDEPPPLPTVTVIAADANAAELDNAGSFAVHRTGSTASSLTVTYTLSGTAQNGADYQTLSTSLTIPAGASSANIAVNPIDDSAVESDETVTVAIVANSAYTVGSPGNATVTIADNDQAPLPRPVVAVLATDALASEAGPDNGAFQITRTGSTAAALTVRFVLAGTARNGVDYQTIPSSVIIPAGASSATITVRPVNDPFLELAETVNLRLSSDPAYELDLLFNAATVSINDNDLL